MAKTQHDGKQVWIHLNHMIRTSKQKKTYHQLNQAISDFEITLKINKLVTKFREEMILSRVDEELPLADCLT